MTASYKRLAALLLLERELDDQDRVLRGQTDDGDQADLEEHVVGHARDHAPRTPNR